MFERDGEIGRANRLPNFLLKSSKRRADISSARLQILLIFSEPIYGIVSRTKD